MAIRYNERTRTFHLYNDQISYIMRVMENEQLENLYYGKEHGRNQVVALKPQVKSTVSGN